MSRIGIETGRITWRAFFYLLFIGGPTVAPAAGCAPSAKAAHELTLPGQWRQLDPIKAPQWLRFEAASPSLVSLEVTTPLMESGRAVLTVLGPDCQAEGERFTFLFRTATRQLLQIHQAGEYYIRIRPEDPLQTPRSYRLMARSHNRPQDESTPKDTEEIEIDPGDMSGGSGTGSDPGQQALCDPTGLLTAGPRGLICAAGDGVDDFGDSPTCASPLSPGHEIVGILGNPWGDDTDVFRFTLEEPQLVRIEARGEGPMIGALYDHRSYRLATGGNGADTGFRLFKALLPGRYSVRIESPGSLEVAYSLRLDAGEW